MSDDLVSTSAQQSGADGDDQPAKAHPAGPAPDAVAADEWYQQRKCALALAVLPRVRYHRAFEPGCGDGRLTQALAPRCDAVVCWDADPAAAAAAAARLAGADHVSIAQARLPHDWPDGRADLVVLSEVGCFLPPAELGEVVERSARALEPGGQLLAVHRRAPMPLYPGGGDDVHARLFGMRGVLRIGGYTDQDLRIDLFERPVL